MSEQARIEVRSHLSLCNYAQASRKITKLAKNGVMDIVTYELLMSALRVDAKHNDQLTQAAKDDIYLSISRVYLKTLEYVQAEEMKRVKS